MLTQGRNRLAGPLASLIAALHTREEALRVSVHVALALVAPLCMAACTEPSAQTLQRRATASMNPAQTCNQTASVQYLPNGARIEAPEMSLFTIGRTDLSACGQYILSSVVQAMLDPRIMQVVVEPGGDINSPDAFLPHERAVTVQAFLSNVGFVAGQPPVLVQAAAIPGRNWGIVLTTAGGA
jgi:hypothetical protein